MQDGHTSFMGGRQGTGGGLRSPELGSRGREVLEVQRSAGSPGGQIRQADVEVGDPTVAYVGETTIDGGRDVEARAVVVVALQSA